MKKKILAGILAICLTMSLSSAAFAADGEVPTGPNDSSHSGSVESSDGTTFVTAGDDDAIAAPADTGGTDIVVWANLFYGNPTDIYKLDIAWGAMSFTYSGGKGEWDPENHVYTADTTPGWVIGGVDGTNNKITITNHSAYGLDANFLFTMEEGTFNNSAGANNVVGNFFANNENAMSAAEVLTDTANLAQSVVTLNNGIGLAPATHKTGETPGAPSVLDLYFAFSGTPDDNKVLDTYANVGTINIIFSEQA